MIIMAAAQDPAVSLSTAQVIIGVLGVGGISGVAVAVVSGMFSRKKLGADATEIITKAAAGVVERTEADNARLRLELDEERTERKQEQSEFRRLVDEHTRALQLHAAWDHLAYAKLEEAGITGLPKPPPLYAPETAPSSLKDNPQVS